MARSGAELLNDDGSLACNAITCCTLKGTTANVFRECTQLIDTKQHPIAFLAEVWHELLASKSLNRLTPDERLVLLLEVGAARIGRLVSTKASQKECNAMLALVEQHTTVGAWPTRLRCGAAALPSRLHRHAAQRHLMETRCTMTTGTRRARDSSVSGRLTLPFSCRTTATTATCNSTTSSSKQRWALTTVPWLPTPSASSPACVTGSPVPV